MKPTVKTACPANRFTSRDERIIEFSFPARPNDGDEPRPQPYLPGGLIAFRNTGTADDPRPTVEVYRTEGQVRVTSDAPIAAVPRFACYIGIAKFSLRGITLHETYRQALREVLNTANEGHELLLDWSKIEDMEDDDLADAIREYADDRDVDYHIEAITL